MLQVLRLRSRIGPSEVRAAYGTALLLSVASILVSVAAAGDSVFAPVIAGVMQGAALLATLLVSGVRRFMVVASLVLAVLATLLAAVFAYTSDTTAHPAAPALWALIVLAAIVAVGGRLARFERVNLQTVLGLLTIYVLTGLLYAHVFALVDATRGGFFAGGESDTASFVYFSYITLTTVGFGDLRPLPGIPRALAVIEAVSGQLYLVSVVALAIGRFGDQRRRNTGGDRDEAIDT